MRLIRVAARVCGTHAARRIGIVLQDSQRALESDDSRELLRRQTHVAQEQAFELPATEPTRVSRSVNRHETASTHDRFDDERDSAITLTGGDRGNEPVLHECNSPLKRRRVVANGPRSRRKSRRHVRGIERRPDELALWHAREPRRAVRAEAYAEHRHVAAGTKRERALDLTREDRGRLRLRDDLRIASIEAVAEMNDEFRAPVRENRLRSILELARVALERPVTGYGRSETRRRAVLAILHLCTLQQSAAWGLAAVRAS